MRLQYYEAIALLDVLDFIFLNIENLKNRESREEKRKEPSSRTGISEASGNRTYDP